MKPTSLGLLLLATSALQGAVLYEQDYVLSSARFSDYGSVTQVGFSAYDDFTPSISGTVERVIWQGIWLDLNKPVPEPIQIPMRLAGKSVSTRTVEAFREHRCRLTPLLPPMSIRYRSARGSGTYQATATTSNYSNTRRNCRPVSSSAEEILTGYW